MNPLEIKICGQTRPDEAAACAAAGADAVGVIFHPDSPRSLDTAQARDIIQALPAGFPVIGVFVDQPAATLMRLAEKAGLTRVQLHGNEPPEVVEALLAHGFRVIKVLKNPATLFREEAALPGACGLLVECGKGALPGGNGSAWNWSDARMLGDARPFALAGGLGPDNAAAAAYAAHPSALDVCSGVESEPGRKDPDKIRRLLQAVRALCITWPVFPVFGDRGPKGPPCPDNP